MPILQGNNDQMMALAMNLIQQAHERQRLQGQQQIATATPGQTVGDVGMSQKQFAELFGKETPYDLNRVLKDQKSSDITDDMVKNYLKTLSPLQQLDIVATNLNNQSGVAGPTTMKGLEASRGAAETKAIAQQHTAQSVADMIDQGIAQMKKAPTEIQGRIGQQAAYGTTTDQQQTDLQSNLLKMSALKEAISAQTNPNAPIHKTLAEMGLNLPTVLASVAMGTTNLLDSYARVWEGARGAKFSADNELRKAEIKSAEEMAKTTFGGKLNTRQVLALMDAQSTGKVPKGLEGAFQLYSQGVNASYDAQISEMIAKGDPMATSIAAQISALTKPGVDPNTISAVNDLSTRSAAYLITKKQFGGVVPDDAAGIAQFDKAMKYNLDHMPRGGVHFPLVSIGSSQAPSGLGTPSFNPAAPGAVAPSDNAPAVRPVSPVTPVSGVPSGLLTTQSGQDVSKAPPALAPDQQEAIARYMQSIGMGAAKP